MDNEASARIEALETKVAFLEATLQQLSDVLYQQQQALDRVLERNRQLLEEVSQAPGGASATDVEIPPHY